MVNTYIEGALSGLVNPRHHPARPERDDVVLVRVHVRKSQERRTLSSSKPRLKCFSARFIKKNILPYAWGDVYTQDLEVVEEKYLEWRDFEEFVVVRRDMEFLCVKARKRGNEKYNNLLQYVISELTKKIVKSKLRALSITLTHERGRYSNEPGEDEFLAWQELGKRFNRLMSWISRRYGKIYFFRVWESTKKGYPHVHMLLFSDRPIYIPQEKLCDIWKAHTWIRRIRSVPRMMRYLTKYLVKTYTKETHLPTAARLWYHGLRSYSISSERFKKLFVGLYLIPTKHYSNIDLMAADIEKGKWMLVGIMTYEEIKTNIRIGVIKFV